MSAATEETVESEAVAFDATRPRDKTLLTQEELDNPTGANIDKAAAALAPPEEIVAAGLRIEPAKLGGKKPQSGSLSFSGMKIDLMPGTFLEKGQVVKFSGEAVVNRVGQQDTRDKETGQVTEATQSHNALVLDLSIEVAE